MRSVGEVAKPEKMLRSARTLARGLPVTRGGCLVNRGEVHPEVTRSAEHLVVPVRRRVGDQSR